MVASSLTAAERFIPLPDPGPGGRYFLPKYTRADVDAFIKLGIIPEDASTELLDGVVALKDRADAGESAFMIGKQHKKCVERLSDLRTQINNAGRHVEAQQPLVCSDTHVPEPDFMIVRDTLDDYTDLPFAADAFCVVEVADASYERDAGEKRAGYARAGVEQYVIINLRNRTAEVYTSPDTGSGTYGSPQIIAASEPLSLRCGPGADDVFTIVLSRVLP